MIDAIRIPIVSTRWRSLIPVVHHGIGSNPYGFAFVGRKKLTEADSEECHWPASSLAHWSYCVRWEQCVEFHIRLVSMQHTALLWHAGRLQWNGRFFCLCPWVGTCYCWHLCGHYWSCTRQDTCHQWIRMVMWKGLHSLLLFFALHTPLYPRNPPYTLRFYTCRIVIDARHIIGVPRMRWAPPIIVLVARSGAVVELESVQGREFRICNTRVCVRSRKTCPFDHCRCDTQYWRASQEVGPSPLVFCLQRAVQP